MSRMKVLLVDDEEDILTLVSATLEDDKRYQVIMARNGDEALALASKQNPELMFLDIRMPGKNGWDVCKALKEEPTTARIKIVMLTALMQESDRCSIRRRRFCKAESRSSRTVGDENRLGMFLKGTARRWAASSDQH